MLSTTGVWTWFCSSSFLASSYIRLQTTILSLAGWVLWDLMLCFEGRFVCRTLSGPLWPPFSPHFPQTARTGSLDILPSPCQKTFLSHPFLFINGRYPSHLKVICILGLFFFFFAVNQRMKTSPIKGILLLILSRVEELGEAPFQYSNILHTLLLLGPAEASEGQTWTALTCLQLCPFPTTELQDS